MRLSMARSAAFCGSLSRPRRVHWDAVSASFSRDESSAIFVARASVGQADRDVPRDAIAVEAGEDLQLLELVGAASDIAVELGELLARRNQSGRYRHGLFECVDGLRSPACIAEAHAEQVVGVG